MSNSRELQYTVAERTIELRKGGICDDHREADNATIAGCPECEWRNGALRLARKRAPKEESLTSAGQLVPGERYRTPMSDNGHRWDEGIFFRCGRYVEYPEYYNEGWDHLFGVYWVKPDPRKQQKCATCYDAVKARNAKAAVAENTKSANKLRVVTQYPVDKAEVVIPEAYTRWVSPERLRGKV